MKKTFVFYLLIFLSLNSFCQKKKSFEGIINYDIKYISKNSAKVDEYLGNEAIVYIKQGNYKQEYPHTKLIKSVLYRQENNMYFSYFNNTDSIEVLDCSTPDDTILNIIKSDKPIEILERKCKSITFQFRNKNVTYFYDQNLFINPIFFSNHKYASYDIFARETESIYLKVIISDTESEFIMTANKLKKKKLEDKEFNIQN